VIISAARASVVIHKLNGPTHVYLYLVDIGKHQRLSAILHNKYFVVVADHKGVRSSF